MEEAGDTKDEVVAPLHKHTHTHTHTHTHVHTHSHLHAGGVLSAFSAASGDALSWFPLVWFIFWAGFFALPTLPFRLSHQAVWAKLVELAEFAPQATWKREFKLP